MLRYSGSNVCCVTFSRLYAHGYVGIQVCFEVAISVHVGKTCAMSAGDETLTHRVLGTD
jgi:hypothetical protein